MKLVYVANSIIPSRAANSVHVMKMCDALASVGYEVTLLVPAVSESDQRDLFESYGVPRSFTIKRLPWVKMPGRGWWFALLAFLAIRRLKADRVYGRHLPSLMLPSMAGIPTAYEAHAPVWETMGKPGMACFRLVACGRGFRKLVVISDALAGWYVRHTMLGENNILVAHDAASPSPNSVMKLGGQRTEGRFELGYVGQLYTGKGMEMIAAVAQRRPSYAFTVVGGDDADIDYWSGRLRNLGNIRFTGFLPQAEAVSLIEGFDAVLAPYQKRVTTAGGGGDVSRWMSPLKIFEYMAAGKPIVASDLPVLQEVLDDGENALLCEPENPDHWCGAIDRLYSETGLGERLGSQARSDFLEHYTWGARACRVLKDVYGDAY
ncbi:glycosyltransferase family 4 protein [Marinobacter sp. VGCF2001]|uniref:glycosyltransferase family 4 protein n=1 Tax=Marinobacter sp. VGCF2001 TaxID=3417189 RepID=UPI003CEF2619